MKPATCFGCPLWTEGTGFAGTDGKGVTTNVLAVAEAPGEAEASKGVPLVGPAGKTWDRMVGRTFDPILGRKLLRDDFLLYNCIQCRPPDNHLNGAPYELAAIAHCRPNLEGAIRDFKPKAILALGNTALRWFTGHSGIEQLRGYVFRTKWGPVVPTYHPSYIMRGNWHLARVVQLDILRAIEVAREGVDHLFRDKAYTLSPTYGEVRDFLEGWRAAGRPPLSFDIETPKAGEAADAEDMTFEDDASYQILMISLAWKPFEAISIPWQEPFISLVKAAFAEDADFVVWHAGFDVPRLMAAGVHFGGRIIDAMLAWHWLEPSLPMGLKWVATFFCPDMHAWKLGMQENFQWYNAADSDVLNRVFLEVRNRLEKQGRWKTFERHFLDFGKILLKMSERGVAVDQEERKLARDRFNERFLQTLDRARDRAPAAILKVSPKRGYKRTPKSTEGLVQIEVELTPQEVEEFRKKREKDREKARKAKEKAERKAKKGAKRGKPVQP